MAVVTGSKENLVAGTAVTTAALNMTGMKTLAVVVSNYTGVTNANDDAATPATDSSGNVWTKIGEVQVGAGVTASYSEMFYVNSAMPSVSASQTFTYTVTNAADFIAIAVIGWDTQASTLDVGDNAHMNGSTTSPITTPNAATTQAIELLVAMFGGGNGGASVTLADAGATAATWTKDEDQSNGAGQPIALGHAITSTTGTYAAKWTDSAGGQLASGIATFKAASGGSVTHIANWIQDE